MIMILASGIGSLYMSSEETKPKDIDKLSGLKQAIEIAVRLNKGENLSDLIQDAKGDQQLVMIWIKFLEDLRWLEESQDGTLLLTPLGQQAIAKYS